MEDNKNIDTSVTEEVLETSEAEVQRVFKLEFVILQTCFFKFRFSFEEIGPWRFSNFANSKLYI